MVCKIIYKKAVNQLSDYYKKFQTQLKREVEIHKNLKHPNIVELYDSFENENNVLNKNKRIIFKGLPFYGVSWGGRLKRLCKREKAAKLNGNKLHFKVDHRNYVFPSK